MPKATRREVIAAALEGVGSYGTDATPGAADAIALAAPIEFNPGESARLIERRLIDGTFGRNNLVHGGSLVSFNLQCELKGSGTVDTPPEWGPLLVACGWQETVNAGTSVVYAPATASASSGHDSATIYYYYDGILYKATGCRGSVSMSAEAGQAGMLTFNMIGHDAGRADSAIISPTLDATTPPAFKSASLTLDSVAATAASFSFDQQAERPARPDINASDGFAEVAILGRDMTGSLPIEVPSVATKDWVQQWLDSAGMALSIGPIGATAGNTWSISAPAAQITNPGFEDSDGVRRHPLELAFAKSSGDDEIQLTLE